MKDLMPLAERLAARLVERRHTIVVAESSAGGLISAALLAIPGASGFFLGGAVVYTRDARRLLLNIPETALADIRPATEAYALLLARTARERFSSTWALSETGATGPTGNRYGDPAGHACFAATGSTERTKRLATGQSDRVVNMRAFAAAALNFMIETVG